MPMTTPAPLNFSANLSFLFGEVDFLERFSAAAAAGFKAVEFHFPYDHDAAVLAEVQLTAGVEVVLFNLPAGNWAAGERGIACLPARKAEFQEGVGRAIEYAEALGCRQLNCLAGIPLADRAGGAKLAGGAAEIQARALETLTDNLRFAASVTQRAGIRLLLEPLNSRDNPGFLIDTTARALAVIEEVGSKNLQLQYDIYHAQVMEGDLVRTLETQLPRIGHIQLADNPGRHEPGTGEIRFEFIFRRLQALGYRGWLGCEYQPGGTTLESLGWLREYEGT